MTHPDCQRCHGKGWLCEEHAGQPWEHDNCTGPGIPCECNPEEENPPDFRVYAGPGSGPLS
jgi:hypothetical protein